MINNDVHNEEEVLKRSGANWMIKLIDNSRVDGDKSRLVGSYILLIFSDDLKKFNVSEQVLGKIDSKMQFYYNKKNTKIGNMFYKQMLEFEWKLHQLMNLNSTIMPLMLNNCCYHLK